MTSEDTIKILKAEEAEKRHLDIGKEAKLLEKHSKTIKAAPPKKREKPMNFSNEFKQKSAWARKWKKSDYFLLSFEGSTSESDSTIIEEEIISEEEEEDESDEENECVECKETYFTGELWIQCDNGQEWYHAACTSMHKKSKRQLDSLESWQCKLTIVHKIFQYLYLFPDLYTLWFTKSCKYRSTSDTSFNFK